MGLVCSAELHSKPQTERACVLFVNLGGTRTLARFSLQLHLSHRSPTNCLQCGSGSESDPSVPPCHTAEKVQARENGTKALRPGLRSPYLPPTVCSTPPLPAPIAVFAIVGSSAWSSVFQNAGCDLCVTKLILWVIYSVGSSTGKNPPKPRVCPRLPSALRPLLTHPRWPL